MDESTFLEARKRWAAWETKRERYPRLYHHLPAIDGFQTGDYKVSHLHVGDKVFDFPALEVTDGRLDLLMGCPTTAQRALSLSVGGRLVFLYRN